MLYALGDPLAFALLLASFVVCVTATSWITAVLSARAGAWSLRQERRTRPDPRRHVDPFGAIAGLIAGFGWGKPVDAPRKSAGQVALVLLTGPVLLLAAGLGSTAGLAAVTDVPLGQLLDAIGPSNVVQRGISTYVPGFSLAEQAWLLVSLMAVQVGALALVPLPPLPAGQVLFAAAPRTLGWQKAEHQLVERNIGTAVLLALLLIPLGSTSALLPTILNTVLGPLLRLVSGG